MPSGLTIAIPTLNRADLVARAIESALAQTSTEVEVIVSDNGSTDHTAKILDRYEERGLRVFRHSLTMPATAHGQFLLEQAQREFFVGLSDDDFLEPDFAAEVLALFNEHPDLSLVYTGCAIHYQDCRVSAVVGPSVESGTDFLAAHYADQREICWCACAARVQDLLELGPQPDTCTIGDMFYWTKLAFRGPVGCVPRVLSNYVLLRPRIDNVSHSTPPMIWARESRSLANDVIQESRRKGMSDHYIAHLEADCARHIARSTANQFIWNRLRGATRSDAWSWLLGSMPYLTLSPVVFSRLTAGLLLSEPVLRRAVISGAKRLSAKRTIISALSTGLEMGTSNVLL